MSLFIPLLWVGGQWGHQKDDQIWPNEFRDDMSHLQEFISRFYNFGREQKSQEGFIFKISDYA